MSCSLTRKPTVTAVNQLVPDSQRALFEPKQLAWLTEKFGKFFTKIERIRRA